MPQLISFIVGACCPNCATRDIYERLCCLRQCLPDACLMLAGVRP
jgi:hypothetical protein